MDLAAERKTLRARPALGAAYLDGIKPGWEGEIRIDKLDMGCCWDCVVGQLYGDYSDAIDDIAPPGTRAGFTEETDDVTPWAVSQGFDFDAEISLGRSEQLAILRAAWTDEVLRRLEAKS